MRRFATLGLVLMLAGCGYRTWWSPPFFTGSQPYAPAGDAENLLRAKGDTVTVPPLTPQPGDVWPGPVPPTPTLQELEQQGDLGMGPEQPVPGSPLNRGAASQEPASGQPPPGLPPQMSRGSSTPPGSNQPGLAPLPKQQAVVPSHGPSLPPPPAAGQVVQTPSGPGVTTGGTQGYQTMTMPGGGSAIVVPNGNGTSTIIKSDGSIQTIPTPH
ncbi:MAG TPA: hypothetical protein VND19_06595 [Acetobacteraceae bacterium]|nr:hypothetical protein [Acetobacteraceae bacterium]